MRSTQGKTTTLLVKVICLLLSGVGLGWLIGLSVSPIIHIIITSLIALVVSVTGALAGIDIQKEDSDAQADKPKRKTRVEVDPVPLMFIVIGLVVGSSFGVYARTNNWLGPNPNSFAEKWKDTELTKKEISRRLFDELYPPRADSATSASAGGSSTPSAQSDRSTAGSGPSTENSNNSPTDASGLSGGIGVTQPPKKESGTSAGKSNPPAGSDSAMARSRVSALFSNVDADDCSQFRATRDENLRDVMESSVGSNEEARQLIRQCPDIKCLRELVRKICSK